MEHILAVSRLYRIFSISGSIESKRDIVGVRQESIFLQNSPFARKVKVYRNYFSFHSFHSFFNPKLLKLFKLISSTANYCEVASCISHSLHVRLFIPCSLLLVSPSTLLPWQSRAYMKSIICLLGACGCNFHPLVYIGHTSLCEKLPNWEVYNACSSHRYSKKIRTVACFFLPA